jgi:hypothetical protein
MGDQGSGQPRVGSFWTEDEAAASKSPPPLTLWLPQEGDSD